MNPAGPSGPERRIQISFDSWCRYLSFLVGLPAAGAYLKLSNDDVEVRMGWAFRSRFPRSAIRAVLSPNRRPLSRGVHGFGGRWLVNGSGDGIVSVQLEPAQRAYVVGVPIRLRELLVSVEDPGALTAGLQNRA
jgi:hypothetical protein